MKITALLLAIISLLLLSGCDSEEQEHLLLGKWTTTIEDVTLSRDFKSDGTIIETVNDLLMEGTYIIDNDRVFISMTSFIIEDRIIDIPYNADWEFSFSINGNNLTLVDLNLDGDDEFKRITYQKD